MGEIRTRTIGELVDAGMISITTGFACGEHNADRKGVLQVRPFNVTPLGEISLSEQKHVPMSVAVGKEVLAPGDILFNNTNTKELVGKTALWELEAGAVFSNHMTRIRVLDPSINPRFLATVIHAHWLSGQSQMLARAHVAQASILGERLRDIEVPWASPEMQAAVARVFGLLVRSLTIESEAVNTALRLKLAVRQTLFTEGLRQEPQKATELGPIPESWVVVSLGSLGRVGNGSTPKRSVSEYWNGGTYPWLTSAKMYDREIVAADQYVTALALKECHLPQVQPGSVLIAITGQGKTLGHCAILRIPATISQHVAYVAVDATRADPSFVRGYLETRYDYLRQVASGGGSTKGALTCAFLRDLPIPLAPLEEQREIASVLDVIDRKTDLHRRRRAVLEALFKTLLHKLMTGESRVTDLDLSALESVDKPEVAA